MKDRVVTVSPRDSLRQRIFIASLGLWLTLDAGSFDALQFDTKTGTVKVGLTRSSQFTPEGRLRIEQPAKIGGIGTYGPKLPLKLERGAYVIRLDAKTTWVELTATR
jgi:hypothetical protein